MTNFVFSYWNEDGANIGSVNPISVVMDTEHVVTAVYVAAIFVNLNVTAGANGTVSPIGLQNLQVGKTYAFTAEPDTDHYLDHWELNGANKGASNPLTLNATAEMANATLTALFSPTPPIKIAMTITVSGNGTTDVAIGQHEFNVGSTVSFKATPQPGNIFVKWRWNGTESTTNPLILVIDEGMNGKTLTAEFTPIVPIQAGFPIWAIPVGAAILIGGYILSRKGKNRKR